MPQTRSTKIVNETPLQKLSTLNLKLDQIIFFNYYDGFATNGMISFKVDDRMPVKSAEHQSGIYEIMSKSQPYSKSKELAPCVQKFIQNGKVPPNELGLQFIVQEV